MEFETWRLQVRQLVDEAEDDLSNKQIRRIIIQSLQRPALDTVKTHTGSTQQLLEILDNLYGSVVDSQELLIQYYSKYQVEKESASTYLQRLYLLATEVADKGGVTVGNIPELLLRQFIRGSHNEILIQKLDLEELVDEPPSFAELLLSMRKEEARRTEKRLRLKSSGRVATVASVVVNPECSKSDHLVADQKEMTDLRTRLAELEAQVHQQHKSASNIPSCSRNSEPHQDPEGAVVSVPDKSRTFHMGKATNRSKRKCFCYRCGEDGHCANSCQKVPNPELVQQKLLLRCSVNC